MISEATMASGIKCTNAKHEPVPEVRDDRRSSLPPPARTGASAPSLASTSGLRRSPPSRSPTRSRGWRGPTQCVQRAGIRCRAAGPRRPDCVADDAVSCELVSAPNSLLTGKLTGTFANSGPQQRFPHLINELIQSLAAKFPTQRNREFLQP